MVANAANGSPVLHPTSVSTANDVSDNQLVSEIYKRNKRDIDWGRVRESVIRIISLLSVPHFHVLPHRFTRGRSSE